VAGEVGALRVTVYLDVASAYTTLERILSLGVCPVEILDLRHFASADLRPLLEEESSLWIESLAWDYSSSADMILRYLDAKILPGYAALERGRLLGYCFFVYEGNKGVVGDLYASSSGNHTTASPAEVENRLVEHVIATLQQSPGIHRIEAQLLIHGSGEAAAPFVQEGFRRYPRLFMKLPLRQPAPNPGRPLPPGIEIRRWSDQDYQPAAGLITAAYRGHIDSDINDQYRTVTGSLRFLNNIIRFPGCGVFDEASSFVAFHRPTHSNIGLILCSRVKDDAGHVTQVCLLPEYRRHGIGEHLIAATRDVLRSRGFALLTLTVTQANERAVQLYERLGFSLSRVFDAFVWEG
jgi:ribosomal protein S18 acetylase RimI-like enzyme